MEDILIVGAARTAIGKFRRQALAKLPGLRPRRFSHPPRCWSAPGSRRKQVFRGHHGPGADRRDRAETRARQAAIRAGLPGT